ncbi:hypothetical protein LZF95_14250 [Algoriphagus sp. AGSA1]|nr:hypothetical protein [Algoriphagus sp. AGSA1]
MAAAILLGLFVYFLDYFILRSNLSLEIICLENIYLYEIRSKFSFLIDNILNITPVPGLKHAILIFLISYPLAQLLNLLFTRKFSFDYTIERWGNHLERIIWFSLTEKKDEDKLLMITTKTNKVYIGYINRLSEPIGESYVTIIPNFSGYRDKETQKLEITTSYTDVLEKYVTQNKEADIGNKLGVILPTNEILFVSRFDSEIFGRFNENDQETAVTYGSFTKKLISLIINKIF